MECTVGDEIYAEIYRDSGAADGSQLLARRAQRENGLWPDWMEAYDSESSYDRYAYLKATAQEVGQWSFVAEIANRDNANQGRGTHVAFVRINLTVHETAGSEYPAGSSTGYVLCEFLSVRESPDPYANVIGTLTYGTTFLVSQKTETGGMLKPMVKADGSIVVMRYLILSTIILQRRHPYLPTPAQMQSV